MNKIALITGINGQDGSFLTEFLLDKKYIVHGIIRRSSLHNLQRLENIIDHPNLNLHYGDVTDSASIEKIIDIVKPDELYHLAAQSQVKVSFDIPKYTSEVGAIGTLNILEGVRKNSPLTKIYNACTSELFGKVQEIPQKESTPFYPRSPYGVSKLYSYWIAKNYRESYNLFITNGILFNHESERRGKSFVTRKITIGLSNLSNNYKIVEGYQDILPLQLGNLYSKRDWGYTPDYIRGMWQMLQLDAYDDFVLATGKIHSIKEFINECIGYTKFKGQIKWEGKNLEEKLLYKNIILIEINSEFYRPAEVDFLIGDYSKAKNTFGWEPKISFKILIKKMMEADLKEIKNH